MFRKSVEKIQVSFKSDTNDGTFYEELYTFLIVPRSILSGIKMIQTNFVDKIENKHFRLNKFFLKNNCRL
jgi:hypothetical protein